MKHYYIIDIFNVVIDFQSMEINERFSNNLIEFFTLSFNLDPIHYFKSFNINDICNLIKKNYFEDFTRKELEDLRRQLMHYEINDVNNSKFQIFLSFSISL